MSHWPRQVSREEADLRIAVRGAVEHALDRMEAGDDTNEILGWLIARLTNVLGGVS